MTNYTRYCTSCANCGGTTSKSYARANNGLCKSCNDPNAPYNGPKCRDCDGPIEAWKLRKGYHCDACTRRCDPWGMETRGY